MAAKTDDVASASTPAQAFRLARSTWLAGERVEMGVLSTELGISRPTLYKWCGDRSRLLTDVIWSVTDATLDDLVKGSEHLRGVERLVAIEEGFIEAIAASPAMEAYLGNETHAAVRLLTSRGGFRDRLIDRVSRDIANESARADLVLREDPDLLAWAIVRLTEGIIYNDAVGSVEPELDRARDVIRLIIG